MSPAEPPYDDPELLASALARTPDCPPLERIAAVALGEPAEEDAAAVLAHARACPACGAELALASGFAEDAAPSAEVDRVVERVRAATPAAAGRVVEFKRSAAPPSSRPSSRRWAAAAMLLLGVGLAWRAARYALPPDPGDPHGRDVARGAEVELLAPVGEVAGAPAEVTWRPVAGAELYRVELLDVAGDALGGGETSATSYALAPELRARLRPPARYAWRVVALDRGGAELARSATTEFIVRPLPPLP